MSKLKTQYDPKTMKWPIYAVDIHNSSVADQIQEMLDASWCQNNIKTWVYCANNKIYCGARKDAQTVGKIVDRHVIMERLKEEQSRESMHWEKAEKNPYFNVF